MKQSFFTLFLMLCVSGQVVADWQDWWRTPEQQARAAFDEGDSEQLIRIAPDAAWQGVAEHESADYESAAKTFDEVVTQQDLAGNTGEATRALYNRAVSEVRSADYRKAVESFDQVLERNPEFADAQYNREIASQLMQQQEQQQQQSPSQPQEGDESADQSDEDSESQESSEQASSSDNEQSQSGDQQQSDSQASEDSEQAEPGAEEGAEQGDDSDASEAQSEAQQLRDQQAARDALDAEARQGGDDDEPSDQDGRLSAVQREAPLSESEQATEQWLRRIPDDPAGLLRRKLEQSHRIEYPEVRNAREPW